MTKKPTPTTRDELVAQFEERNAECQRLLTAMIAGTEQDAWVVRNPRGNLCMRYRMERGQAYDPRACPPDMATRFFDKIECMRIAAMTVNGAGEAAEAVLQSTALGDDIAETLDLIKTIQEKKI